MTSGWARRSRIRLAPGRASWPGARVTTSELDQHQRHALVRGGLAQALRPVLDQRSAVADPGEVIGHGLVVCVGQSLDLAEADEDPDRGEHQGDERECVDDDGRASERRHDEHADGRDGGHRRHGEDRGPAAILEGYRTLRAPDPEGDDRQADEPQRAREPFPQRPRPQVAGPFMGGLEPWDLFLISVRGGGLAWTPVGNGGTKYLESG
jgi:hypothetical protein